VKENIVTISGHQYRYTYDPETQQTAYLGPVGDSPPMGEEDFVRAMCDIEANRRAAIILDAVEDYLDSQDILIPDNMRTGDPDEPSLYGETYYNLEEIITDILIEQEQPLEPILNEITKVAKNRGVVLNKDQLREKIFPLI
jgi:hypothetical protein